MVPDTIFRENSGARAIYSQQNSVPKPGSVHGWLGSYILNTRGVPNGNGLAYQNGLKASANRETDDKWTVYNNIYHGHSAETFDNVVEWDYNINTNGAALGPNDRSIAAAMLYQDPAKEDFSYPLTSPARTFKAKDWSTLLRGFQSRWPNFDGWGKDMVGAPIDWTNPPIGPTVDLDADMGNRPLD